MNTIHKASASNNGARKRLNKLFFMHRIGRNLNNETVELFKPKNKLNVQLLKVERDESIVTYKSRNGFLAFSTIKNKDELKTQLENI